MPGQSLFCVRSPIFYSRIVTDKPGSAPNTGAVAAFHRRCIGKIMLFSLREKNRNSVEFLHSRTRAPTQRGSRVLSAVGCAGGAGNSALTAA